MTHNPRFVSDLSYLHNAQHMWNKSRHQSWLSTSPLISYSLLMALTFFVKVPLYWRPASSLLYVLFPSAFYFLSLLQFLLFFLVLLFFLLLQHFFHWRCSQYFWPFLSWCSFCFSLNWWGDWWYVCEWNSVVTAAWHSNWSEWNLHLDRNYWPRFSAITRSGNGYFFQWQNFIFTARALLSRYMTWPCVRLSVCACLCLSQVGVLLK